MPFKDRFAATKLLVIDSEVHQLFGRYSGKVLRTMEKKFVIDGLIGFAEEHKARW